MTPPTDTTADRLRPHRALYAAFDRYPSAKGAATHIRHSARALFDAVGGSGLLYVVGDLDLPRRQLEDDGNEIIRFRSGEPNVLRRTESFGVRLDALLETHAATLDTVQFRDPWGGLVCVAHPKRRWRCVYEVNGLPSIELAATYPHAAPATLARVRELERRCWQGADALITPSATIADNLVRLGAPADAIQVIPNGADLTTAADRPRPADAPDRYLVYVGALQPWQGVDVALRAFARLADLDIQLVICASTKARTARDLQRLARNLGIDHRVVWHHRLHRNDVAAWLSHAELSFAPLTACARNLDQGACPLKILESLAAGTPVVASDLPAVREIVTDRVVGRLVAPDRPAELARATRVLLEFDTERRAMGDAGRDLIRRHFTWERHDTAVRALHTKLLQDRPQRG